MDLGSTKSFACEAMNGLPETVGNQKNLHCRTNKNPKLEFPPGAIGGHPMTGKETSGPQEADPDLYKG